jgi:SAM-dependent methyltransferase
MNEDEIRRRLSQYYFYHVIPLTESIATPGDPRHTQSQSLVIEALQGIPLKGKRVLDVGCRDGLFSFLAEGQGASEIIGIDNCLSKGAVELVIPFLRSSVKMYEMNLYDLRPERFGQFEVIIFAGLLYHLRYPFWGLKVLRDVIKPGGVLLLETAIFYGCDGHAMLYCPLGDDSPYEATSCAFFNRKGLLDTMAGLGWRTLSFHCLHPDAEAAPPSNGTITIDRAVAVCVYTGQCGNDLVNRYWHGTHDLHDRLAKLPEGTPPKVLLKWSREGDRR